MGHLNFCTAGRIIIFGGNLALGAVTARETRLAEHTSGREPTFFLGPQTYKLRAAQ
jgi:hypothetical protein